LIVVCGLTWRAVARSLRRYGGVDLDTRAAPGRTAARPRQAPSRGKRIVLHSPASASESKMTVGKADVATISAMAQNALKVSYRIGQESRKTYTEEIPFDAPRECARW
jgi:hypothetical protein